MSAVTPPLYKRAGVFATSDYETALVVFGGEVLAITFVRGWDTFGYTGIRVRRWATGEVLAEKAWAGSMGCAIVKDGVIHIFGHDSGNKIIHSTLAADFTPSAPVDALLMNAPGNPFKFYNTSVTADANGFRMVIETTAGVYFARSSDLDAWTYAGGEMMAGQYCGCPSIHFIGGVHYLTWLNHDGGGRYSTKTAKSLDDCFTFTYGKTLLTANASEGTNNSDVDMIEFNGKVCGVYIDGDQTTYANLRTFTYDGSLAQMFAEFS